MHYPAFALGWHMWRRSRVALVSTLGLVVAIALVVRIIPEAFESPNDCAVLYAPFLMVVMVTMLATSFTAGEAQPIKELVGVPTWMLRLPLQTEALVGWPMLYGTTFVGVAWIAWAVLVLWPCNVYAPLLWPTCLFGAISAWLQVWRLPPSPVSRRYSDLLIAGLLILGCGLLLERAFHVRDESVYLPVGAIPEVVLVVFFGALIPLAFRAGVERQARLRCGETLPLPRVLYVNFPMLARWVQPSSDLPFTSAAAARLWLDWRQNGLLAPIAALMIQMFALMAIPAYWLVYRVFHLEAEPKEELLGNLWLIVPGCIGVVVTMLSPASGLELDDNCFFRRLAPLKAIRPVRTGEMVVTRLQVITLTILLTWALTLSGAACLFLLCGNTAGLPGYVKSLNPVAFLSLLAVGGVAVPWCLAVQNMWVGFTGRVWLVCSNLVLLGAAWFALVLASNCVEQHVAVIQAWLRQPPPWLLGLVAAAVLVKLGTAAWAIWAVDRLQLLDRATIVRLLGIWLGIYFCLVVLVIELLPDEFVGWPWIAVGILLILPLTQVAVAPLALAWNRHR